MIIIKTVAEMQQFSQDCHRKGQTVGFVPTMGFLHEGHLSLIDIAKSEADVVIVSLFVNPTQFGPNEDLSAYPRDFDSDENLCRDRGVVAVFYPQVEQMYANNFSTWVDENALTTSLCGGSRPGHFRGVTTVVTKLFNTVLPDVAVFGQKDAQQSMVIARMVRDLNFPIKVIVAPIVRESDGLAMSSRNKYLSDEQRMNALSIIHSLTAAEKMYQSGERVASIFISEIRSALESSGGIVDYVGVVSQELLTNVDNLNKPTIIAIAAYFGKTRLIDNVFLG